MAAHTYYGDLSRLSRMCAPPEGVCRVSAGGVLLVLGLQGVSEPERGQAFMSLCGPTCIRILSCSDTDLWSPSTTVKPCVFSLLSSGMTLHQTVQVHSVMGLQGLG